MAQPRWVAWLESWDVDVRGSCRVRSGAAVRGEAVAVFAVRLHGGGAPYSQAQIVGSCGVQAVCERRVTCILGACEGSQAGVPLRVLVEMEAKLWSLPASGLVARCTAMADSGLRV